MNGIRRETDPIGHPSKILVVDDETELANLIKIFLESAGFHAVVRLSGADALKAAEHDDFSGIVADLRMPDVGGEALWHAIRSANPVLASRIVFITGDILSGRTWKFVEQTKCRCLEKPFTKRELIATVRQVLA